MSEVLRQPLLANKTKIEGRGLRSYFPAIFAIGGSVLLVLLRFQLGGGHFLSDGGLMLIPLACYLLAAVFYIMNPYTPAEMAHKVGFLLAAARDLFQLP